MLVSNTRQWSSFYAGSVKNWQKTHLRYVAYISKIQPLLHKLVSHFNSPSNLLTICVSASKTVKNYFYEGKSDSF